MTYRYEIQTGVDATATGQVIEVEIDEAWKTGIRMSNDGNTDGDLTVDLEVSPDGDNWFAENQYTGQEIDEKEDIPERFVRVTVSSTASTAGTVDVAVSATR